MVREIKDPGIDLGPREPQRLPPMLESLARLDARAKAGRVTSGVRRNVSFAIDASEKRELIAWAEESGKNISVLMRELAQAALVVRSRRRSPFQALYDAARKSRAADD